MARDVATAWRLPRGIKPAARLRHRDGGASAFVLAVLGIFAPRQGQENQPLWAALPPARAPLRGPSPWRLGSLAMADRQPAAGYFGPCWQGRRAGRLADAGASLKPLILSWDGSPERDPRGARMREKVRPGSGWDCRSQALKLIIDCWRAHQTRSGNRARIGPRR